MNKQVSVDPAAIIPHNDDSPVREVAPDIGYKTLAIVNVVFIGAPGSGDREWVLIDAGLPGTENTIVRAAESRFGKDARPRAIVMTHGHFDHIGSLRSLAERWDAPIVAHVQEFPFLTGARSYPPADPSVGGGMMARLSGLFPRGPIDVSNRLVELASDGLVPYMEGWKWIHTPGHAPGHVSFWREEDRSLIAGDAFITTHQEAVYASLTQEPELHGPPQYYTPDWISAEQSVKRLAVLEPELAVTGHGVAMRGPALRQALHTLADNFAAVAIPAHGKYVPHAGEHSSA